LFHGLGSMMDRRLNVLGVDASPGFTHVSQRKPDRPVIEMKPGLSQGAQDFGGVRDQAALLRSQHRPPAFQARDAFAKVMTGEAFVTHTSLTIGFLDDFLGAILEGRYTEAPQRIQEFRTR
jgi:hypothetical protein